MLSAHETRVLLDKLCIALGFCLPPTAYDALTEKPSSDINEFTNAVFIAEGFLDPSTADRHLYRQVRAMVTQAFRESEQKKGDAS
jgi:hypothetical protein